MGEHASGRAAQQVLILHGWQNRRPEGHWQRLLADEWEAAGTVVRYPQLPDPDFPQHAAWLDALDEALAGLDPARLTVVAHSLGCVLWLDHLRRRAARGDRSRVARLSVLAAPPAAEVLAAEPAISDFAALRIDDVLGAAIAGLGGEVVVVAGDDDPYCPAGARAAFAEPLGAELVTVAGGGHLTIEDGFGPFPLVRELVEGVHGAA